MNLNIKSDYDFSFLAPAILETGYRATLLGILDFDTAIAMQTDLVAIHAQVYPNLRAGTPIAADALTYLRIRTQSGDVRVIAQEWLAADPILVTNGTVWFQVYNVTSSDSRVISDLLIANGYTTFNTSFSGG